MAEGVHRSVSYSEPRRVTSAPPSANIDAMACGRLERGSEVAQCVIVHLEGMSQALGVVPPYDHLHGLLTCHHVLPSVSDNTWKLVMGPTQREKHQLSPGKVIKCFSCCGPNGFWQPQSHIPLEGNRAAGLCPARGDWTLVILQPTFVAEIQKGREYFFPLITPFSQEVLQTAFQLKSCRLFERNSHGTIVQHFVDINPDISHPKEGRPQLESEVCSYREMSILRYPMTYLSTIKAGCSGAPIFCLTAGSLESLHLLGIHSSSPDLSVPGQNGSAEQYGVAVPYILDSAIKDGSYCHLTACLAFVTEAVKKNKCLSLSVRKLTKHLVRHKQDLQRTDQSHQEGRMKQIKSNLELVDFIVGIFPEHIRGMKYQTLKQEKETSLPYMELLCTLFSCFEGYNAAELGVAVVEGDRVNLPVVGHVEGVCRSLYSLMKSLKEAKNSEDTEIVRTGFHLWWNLFHFNIVGGPADSVLNDSTSYCILNEMRSWEMFENDAYIQRMFGNISVAYQSKMRRDKANELQEQRAELEEEVRKCQAEQKAQQEEKVRELDTLKTELHRRGFELETLRKENAIELEALRAECDQRLEACEHQKAQAAQDLKLVKEELQKEKAKVQQLINKLVELKKCPVAKNGGPSSWGTSGPPPTQQIDTDAYYLMPTSQQDFWSQDICDVLQKTPSLCTKVASYFEKVKGARYGSWEHLMVEVKCDLDKKELETLPVNDILLAILHCWKKRCQVTVHRFCKVSEAIGNLQVTVHMKSAAEQQRQEEVVCGASEGRCPQGSELHESYQNGGQWDEGKACSTTSLQRSGSEGSCRRTSCQRMSGQYECKLFDERAGGDQPQQTSALRLKTEDIAQYMNPTEISPHLFQKGLLTQDQLSCLNSTHEIKAKNMYIIEKVHSQGTSAVKKFIQCLRETASEVMAHGDLANELESLL